MVKYPQTLLNVRVANKTGWDKNQAIKDVVKKFTDELGEDGQVLVRASGTEPLIRIMAQGETQTETDRITEQLPKWFAANWLNKKRGPWKNRTLMCTPKLDAYKLVKWH